jgi:hypothetical protein
VGAVCDAVVRDELDADLRWRARAFGGVALGGAALGGVAPLSGRAMLLVPRVVLLLVVMKTPEESVHPMNLHNLRWK